jgi:crotonobetainyl-CoA:carnitine CoA-transferase CaiB-like acyl-CoA transferase
MAPLDGLFVLDFSTLLPGPLAGLMLSEAGAEVLKIERPGAGDEMRSYTPRLGADSANFVLLNRGKRSLALDLKSPAAMSVLAPLVNRADILIEQFRPGVMDRLGLGYAALHELNPRLIYCSITGFGQTGPLADKAAHDLNYMAEVGLLDATRDSAGAPSLPPILAADIAGGAYPAVINILLALRTREETGLGAHLDISMADNLFTFQYWGLAKIAAEGRPPSPGAELVTGGSPRYGLYRTADGRYVAAAPLEDRFWANFCELLDLEPSLRRDDADPPAVRAAVARAIATRPAEAWRVAFSTRDVCCNIVASLDEALANPHFAHRGLFAGEVLGSGAAAPVPALPVPLAAVFRPPPKARPSPGLGEA